MANFDVFETGFSNFDETINFGKRAIAGDSLFEISTFGVIQSSESTNSTNDQISLVSCCQPNGKIVVGINNCLTIIKSTEEPQYLLVHKYDNQLEGLALSHCGQYILVTTATSYITIGDLAPLLTNKDDECPTNEFMSLYQENLEGAGKFIGTFSHLKSETPEFYVVTESGLVKKFLIGLDKNVVSETVYDFQSKLNIAAFVYPYIVVEGVDELSVVDLETGLCESDDSLGLSQLLSLKSNLLALDQNKNLYIIEPSCCQIFKVNDVYQELLDQQFRAMSILDDGEQKLVIGQTKNNRIKAFINLTCTAMFFDIPSDHCVHFLNFNAYTEDVVFVAKVCKKDQINELRLQFVTTTEAEMRVHKLIRQGDIEKAELFAKQFGVDPEVVIEAKIMKIATKTECSSQDIDLFLSLLDSIQNHSLRLQFCDSVTCQLPSDTRRVLSYAANIETDLRDTKASEINISVRNRNRFNELLRKFDVYMNVYKTFDHQHWTIFSECDAQTEILKFLRQGDIREAVILIANTFYNEDSVASLTDQTFTEILSNLNPSSKDCLTFLNALIPLVLKLKPQSVVPFVNWLRECILRMDGRVDFPECAFKFLEETSSLMTFSSSVIGSDEARECLINLRLALENIETLTNNFSIRLPLVKCMNDRMGVVKSLLNFRWKLDQFETLMKDFVLPVLLKYCEDVDQFLYEEIQNSMKCQEKYWTDKVHVIIRFLSNQDLKLDLIRDILANTKKPWSDQVKKIAMLAFDRNADDSKVQTIKKLLKDEPVLVVFEKYDINANLFDSSHYIRKEHFFRRILYQCGQDVRRAFADIRTINGDDKLGADYFTAKTLLVSREDSRVLDILDDLPSEHRSLLCKRLFEFLCMYHVEMGVDKSQNLDVLKQICVRALSACNRIETFEFDHQFNTIKGMYEIYMLYGVKSNLFDLSPDGKRKHLTAVLLKEVELLLKGCSNFIQLLDHSKKLGTIFDLTTDAILTEFASLSGNQDILLQIAQQLHQQSEDPDLLVRCAVAILNWSVQSLNDSLDETCLDVILSQNAPSNNDVQAVQMARRLCAKALDCHENGGISLPAILDVTMILNYVYDLDDCDKEMRKIAQIYQVYMPMKITNSQSDVVRTLLMMRQSLGGSEETDAALSYSNCDTVIEENLQDLTVNFLDGIGQLLREEQHLKAASILKLAQLNCQSISNPNGQPVIKSLEEYFVSTLLPELINRVISHSYVDTVLLKELMLQVPRDQLESQISTLLKLYKRQPVKLQALTKVGLSFFDLGLIARGKHWMVHLNNQCKWWFKLNIPHSLYATFFKHNGQENLQLLVRENQLPLECLPEYCQDFQLNLPESYFYYLKTIILNWRPIIEYNTELDGRTTTIVKNADELMQICQKIVAYITDKNMLHQFINDIWPMVNFYYYEVYLVLLKLLEDLESGISSTIESYRPIVKFLKSYVRISAPTRTEIEQWFGLYKSKKVIEPLSTYRLPLSTSFLTDKIWDIIKPEITLDTYKDWLKLAKIGIQPLTHEQICTYAINSVVTKLVATDSDWDLRLRYNDLVDKVNECASSTDNLEFATAAIYSLMCEMPPGADKVRMAQLSYTYAGKMVQNDENPEIFTVFEKVQKRYLTCSVMHILYKYQLDGTKYTETSSDSLPTLINNLYNDPKILEYFDNLNSPCPEINKAVKELCELYKNNFKKIKMGAVVDLLNVDSPLQLDWRRLRCNDHNSHIKRIVYICGDEDKVYWEKFLLDQYRSNSKRQPLTLKTNAAICLYFLSDPDSLDTLTELAIDEFEDEVNKMVVMAKLTDFGIRCDSPSKLDEMNKKKVLKQLMSVSDPNALRCIANLCRIYYYDNIKNWEFIVQSSLNYKMMEDLRDYLVFLSDRSVTETITNGWQSLLTYEFNKLKWEQAKEADVFAILQACPIYKMDLTPFIDKCLSCQRSDLADVLKRFSN